MPDDLLTRRVEAVARALCEHRARSIGVTTDADMPALVERGWKYFIEPARAALAAADAVGPGEAEEWVRVPRDPTWAMRIAGRDAIIGDEDDIDLSTDDAAAGYRAMIAAAPSPEQD